MSSNNLQLAKNEINQIEPDSKKIKIELNLIDIKQSNEESNVVLKVDDKRNDAKMIEQNFKNDFSEEESIILTSDDEDGNSINDNVKDNGQQEQQIIDNDHLDDQDYHSSGDEIHSDHSSENSDHGSEDSYHSSEDSDHELHGIFEDSDDSEDSDDVTVGDIMMKALFSHFLAANLDLDSESEDDVQTEEI